MKLNQWRSLRSNKERVPKFAIIYFVITAIAAKPILYDFHYGEELFYEYGVGTAI
ncbi:hypothetical protein [Nostoc sp. 2RC]|uniref:hypothetical protein n=1 Tax=Nostoc sp. 2RC TaxID=2485484 RepID=UPI001626F4C2|nr:hypothetical protein [Nostoc sp. 2RC]MBC1239760.1 hypothetical protein [Nostoc sp. 2RC]